MAAIRLIDRLTRRIPREIRRPFRQLLYLPADLYEALAGRRTGPPRGLRDVGGGDFDAVGQRFVEHLERLCGLGPESRVLDLGCGIGRMALPLTRIVAPPGRYDGIDVAHRDIRWCTRHIGSRFPHFRFHHADVRNREYNRRGAIDPERFAFPWADSTFDVALAASLFTHLLPSAMRRYMNESARVLAPGGRFLATFFLLDDDARRALERRASGFRFRPWEDGSWAHDPANPEAAIAYEPPALAAAAGRAGLRIERTLPGAWCGRPEAIEYQDLVVLARG